MRRVFVEHNVGVASMRKSDVFVTGRPISIIRKKRGTTQPRKIISVARSRSPRASLHAICTSSRRPEAIFHQANDNARLPAECIFDNPHLPPCFCWPDDDGDPPHRRERLTMTTVLTGMSQIISSACETPLRLPEAGLS